MKKLKKNKKIKIPEILVDTTRKHTLYTLVLQASVRIFLLCLVTIGTCLTTAQVYNIPVQEESVILTSLIWTLIFNLLFILLKFRYAFPLIILTALINFRLNEFIVNIGCFIDFFLLKLDSRMLYTSQFTSRPPSHLTRMPDGFLTGIQESFTVFCIIIALIYAITGRGRFIGSVLITVMLIMIPAFGSEIATLCSGMFPLFLGMFGLYSVWSSQEHSPSGRIYVRRSDLKQRKRKSSNKRFSVIAGLPVLSRHGANGIIAVLTALTAYFSATSLLPAEKSEDLFRFVSDFNEGVVDSWFKLTEGFQSAFSDMIENNGYFPSGGVSSSIELNAPTTSIRPVMNVSRYDITNPLYLKVGIGVKLNENGQSWENNRNDSDIKELEKLAALIYPEREYVLYRQKLLALGFSAESYMGLQQVKIEYLMKTKHVALPTAPYFHTYRNDERFIGSLDTVLSGSRFFTPGETQAWDIMYPKKNNPDFNSALGKVNAAYNYAVYYGGEDGKLIAKENNPAITYIDNLDYLHSAFLYFSQGKNGYTLNDANDESGYIYKPEDITPETAEKLKQDSYILQSENFYKSPQKITDEVKNAVLNSVIHTGASEYGMTAAEYITYVQNYRSLVQKIYTSGSDREQDNINRLKQEMTGVDFKLANAPLSRPIFVQQAVDYFKNNYKYSLSANNKSGENTMLGNFLFNTKQGHCALYATSLTLLLRSEGIPARYVTGYAVNGGERQYDGSYLYTVLERDLHAWVEVYFPDIGWVPYDPTPPITENVFAEAGGSTASETTTSAVTTKETTPVTTASSSIETTPSATISSTEVTQGESGSGLPPHLTVSAILIFTALLFIILIILFLNSVKRVEKKKLARYKAVKTDRTAREIYSCLIKLLKLEGFSAETGELPAEFAVRVRDWLNTKIDFTEIMYVLEKLEFSNESLNTEEYKMLGGFVSELYTKTVINKKPLKRLWRRIIINNVL